MHQATIAKLKEEATAATSQAPTPLPRIHKPTAIIPTGRRSEH